MLTDSGCNNFIKRRHYETFTKLKFRGLCRKAWGLLSGSHRELISLSEIEAAITVHGRRYAGVQSIALSQIVGSEGRCQDFDREFRPLKKHNQERWLGIALAKTKDVPLPAIDLIQIGEMFFVRDGHHRISVAMMFGQCEIDAEVMVWETESPVDEILAMTRQESKIERAVDIIKRKGRRLLRKTERLGGGFSAGSGTPALQGG